MYVLSQGLSGEACSTAMSWGLMQRRQRLMQRPQSWSAPTMLLGEAVHPRRHLPMAMLGGGLLMARRIRQRRRLARPLMPLGMQQHAM